MHYHELRFVSSSGLSRAFGDLHACQGVEGCLIDPGALTLRFSAPAERAAQLMSRLRVRGDLAAWSFQLATVAD